MKPTTLGESNRFFSYHQVLENLTRLNGEVLPFSFRNLTEDVRKHACQYAKCPLKPVEQQQPSTSRSPAVPPVQKNLVRRSPSTRLPEYVTQNREPVFPLLFGTSVGQYRLSEPDWEARASNSRAIYSPFHSKRIVIQKLLDEFNWKILNCDVCAVIDPDETYVEHVLTKSHFTNLVQRNRGVTDACFNAFDRVLLEQIELIKHNNGQPKGSRTTQQFPLYPQWNCQNQTKMPKESYNQLLGILERALDSAEWKKLDERSLIRPIECFWCGAHLSTMTAVMKHLLTPQHRETAYEWFNVNNDDILEYIKEVRNCMTTTKKDDGPSLLTVPFQIGQDRPSCPMDNCDIQYLTNEAKQIVTDSEMMSKLNELMCQKGRYQLRCELCDKSFPAVVSLLQHSISPFHIQSVLSQNRENKFCLLTDYCALVSLLLDVLDIRHDMVSLENVDRYFTLIIDKHKKSLVVIVPNKVEVASSSGGRQNLTIDCPFLIPKVNPSESLTEKECLALSSTLRSILVDNVQVKEHLLTGHSLRDVQCSVCVKKFNSIQQALQHVLSAKHICKVYQQGGRFCYYQDYLAVVRILKLHNDPTEVTKESAPRIVQSLLPVAYSKNSNSSSVNVLPSSSQEHRKFFCDKGCREMNPKQSVVFMNVSSQEWPTLSEAQLVTLYKAIAQELLILPLKCFKTSSTALKDICPVSCLLCGFKAYCTCHYIHHLFSLETHHNRLIEVKVSITDVQFWLNQIVELRRHSANPASQGAINRVWAKIGLSPSNARPSPDLSQLQSSHFVQ